MMLLSFGSERGGRVLGPRQPCQIVVMAAFVQQLGPEAGCGGMVRKGKEIHIQPVEMSAPDLSVLHPVAYLSVITLCRNFFVFEEIDQIGRVGQHLAAGCQQAVDAGEKKTVAVPDGRRCRCRS